MTNKELFTSYLEQLQKIYPAGEAAVITAWVFENKAGIFRSDIIKAPGKVLDLQILKKLNDCLSELLNHKPVQYVLGETFFLKLRIKVNGDVLIPRPETEELVQLVINNHNSKKDESQAMAKQSKSASQPGKKFTNDKELVLDIGTGSGCIAIALKKNLPDIEIHAVDISARALSVARENALSNEVNIKFAELDFLEEENWHAMPVFDIIISNPPYIPLREKKTLARNVTDFEPHDALFVANNQPMIFYEKIASFGLEYLAARGKVYVELHEDYAEQTASIFLAGGYKVQIIKDIYEKERMIIAVKSMLQKPG